MRKRIPNVQTLPKQRITNDLEKLNLESCKGNNQQQQQQQMITDTLTIISYKTSSYIKPNAKPTVTLRYLIDS